MAKSKTGKKPNILLIGIDSLLSTHMSCYGYERLTTPHMDEFAWDGVVFERAFSSNVPTSRCLGLTQARVSSV